MSLIYQDLMTFTKLSNIREGHGFQATKSWNMSIL